MADKTKERLVENIKRLKKQVTELKAADIKRDKAERLAKEAREYAEAIVSTVRESLLVLDADLKIISTNKAFYGTFKVIPKETKGRFIYDLGNKQWGIPKLRELLENILPYNSSFDNFEVAHKFPKIGERIMLLNARRIPRPPAKPRIILLAIEDITERRQLEERTQSLDELKTATEIRSQFTSTVSHELRSPLEAIKEGVNIVLEGLAGNINNEQKNLLEIAKRNTDRLSRLIKDVLDFQKMEKGKMEFVTSENDINEAVLEVREAMELSAKEKGLDLVVDTDDSMPRMRFNRDKIVQALTNLVDNAIKFTEKGRVSIKTLKEKEAAHIIVADSGPGIRSEDKRRLFHPFEQLASLEERKISGTGLGLAISKEIILAHKGRIWVESKFGKGSKFHFTLPIKN